MINDLDRTLRSLLMDEMPRVAERVQADDFDITFDIPNREFTSRLTRPTLNLYLFNVQENIERGRAPWNTSRENGSGATRRPAVQLDCSYLVTAWSSEIEDEHRLLTGAARVLFRNPVLPEEMLEGSLPDDVDIVTQVAQPADVQQIVDIWGVLDNDLKPSVRVTVTLPLELNLAVEAPLVVGREVRMPPPFASLAPAGRVAVNGRLLRNGEPVAGAAVRVDRSSATTRDDGTFELRRVPAGSQQVLVAIDGEFVELEADFTPGERVELELNSAGDEPQDADEQASSETE
jgi:hypothetical protein